MRRQWTPCFWRKLKRIKRTGKYSYTLFLGGFFRVFAMNNKDFVEKKNDGKPFELHTTYEDKALFYRKLMIPYLLLFLLFAALGLYTKMWGWFAAAAVFFFVCIVYLADYLKMKKYSSLTEG